MVEHKVIFKAIVGSKSYGTDTPESDTDYKGVYIQPLEDILSMDRYVEQINVTKDDVYYEVKRFLQLLQVANPTVLELLYANDDCILVMDPAFEVIRKNRDKFLTKQCLNSFSGYAIQQIKKANSMDKKQNWEKDKVTRKDVMDFVYAHVDGKSIPIKKWLEINHFKQEYCGLAALNHMKDLYSLYYAENSEYKGIVGCDSNQVRLSNIPKGEAPVTVVYFNSGGYSSHCKDYREYQTWLVERNEQRYVDVKNHNQKIDGKNMLHCVRLLETAHEISTQKTINVRRPNADYLLKIKKGDLTLSDIITKSEEYMVSIRKSFEESDLPEAVDPNFVNELLIKIRKM